jgi:hypothetical protein
MPRLTPADELLIHQIPEPLSNVVTHHEHWRESYFFVCHPRSGADGDVVILTAASYPARQVLDSFQMGRIAGENVFALHERPYDGDPHTTVIGPVEIEIVEPFKTVRLHVEADEIGLGLDLTFAARTAPIGLRRGTMKAREEIIWDQSHLIQSGTYSGWYSRHGVRHEVDDWWGQRDHSWGIRNHARCPMWMWLALQFDDGMLGVWHWEYANGAPVYTDGGFAPISGADPVPVVGFRHAMDWLGADGEPVSFGHDGSDVAGLGGHVAVQLEDGTAVRIEVHGMGWAAPYGPFGGGQHLVELTTDDGRRGNGVIEITGAFHHRYFPVARAENLPPG